MIDRENLFPAELSKRIVSGRTLYAPVVRVRHAETLIYVSGILSRDVHGEIVGHGDMRAQIDQIGRNLEAALAAAGASLSDLVRTNTYVTDIDEFFRHVDVRMKYFKALPASTTVEVRRLSHPDFLVEIDAIAAI
jgi:2-iminobutanoate/2-iminopropanoate deaminase